jgi:hypothetical protein
MARSGDVTTLVGDCLGTVHLIRRSGAAGILEMLDPSVDQHR